MSRHEPELATVGAASRQGKRGKRTTPKRSLQLAWRNHDAQIDAKNSHDLTRPSKQKAFGPWITQRKLFAVWQILFRHVGAPRLPAAWRRLPAGSLGVASLRRRPARHDAPGKPRQQNECSGENEPRLRRKVVDNGGKALHAFNQHGEGIGLVMAGSCAPLKRSAPQPALRARRSR